MFSSPRSLFGVTLGLLALGITACQAPGAERIVGPDGSAMAHVHCGADQATCFRIAGELCPLGYEMKPVLRSNDGNFLVRCRAGAAPQVAACLPDTANGPAAPARAGKLGPSRASNGWPPPNEPSPLMYPWPSPETTAGVSSAPVIKPAKTSAPRSAARPAELLDLGY